LNFTPEIEKFSDNRTCTKCGESLDINSNFCNKCGEKQNTDANPDFVISKIYLEQLALFFGIDLLVCSLGSFVDYFKQLSWFLIADLIMAFSAIVFFMLNWTENKLLLHWKSFSISKLGFFIIIAVASSCIVHYVADWLNLVIYNKNEHYYEQFKGSILGSAFLIFFTAITPALFEELGYRGFMLSALLKFTDKEQAIYITSFLFAIIHLSFVSLFWLIPFALLLGFTRVKENTIWYGVFFHFTFNLTACLFDLL